MTDPSEPSEPAQARSRLSIVIALLVVVGLCALLAWWLKPPSEPPTPSPAVRALPDITSAGARQTSDAHRDAPRTPTPR